MRITRGFPMPILRVVVTGSDVSGKTTALDELLNEEEFSGCVRVPEAATILITSGRWSPPFEGERLYGFQRAVARKIVELEDEVASHLDPTLGNWTLVCDRGLADGAAYIGPEAFAREIGMSMHEARGRYAAVLYFDPPDERVFEARRENNKGRVFRSYAEILDLHRSTLGAWSDHPNLLRVSSHPTWEQKLAVARLKLRIALGQSLGYE